VFFVLTTFSLVFVQCLLFYVLFVNDSLDRWCFIRFIRININKARRFSVCLPVFSPCFISASFVVYLVSKWRPCHLMFSRCTYIRIKIYQAGRCSLDCSVFVLVFCQGLCCMLWFEIATLIFDFLRCVRIAIYYTYIIYWNLKDSSWLLIE